MVHKHTILIGKKTRGSMHCDSFTLCASCVASFYAPMRHSSNVTTQYPLTSVATQRTTPPLRARYPPVCARLSLAHLPLAARAGLIVAPGASDVPDTGAASSRP